MKLLTSQCTAEMLLLLAASVLGVYVQRVAILEDAVRVLQGCTTESCKFMSVLVEQEAVAVPDVEDSIEQGFFPLFFAALTEKRVEGHPLVWSGDTGSGMPTCLFPHPYWTTVQDLPSEISDLFTALGAALALAKGDQHHLGCDPIDALLLHLPYSGRLVVSSDEEQAYQTLVSSRPDSLHSVESESLLQLLNSITASSAYRVMQGAYRSTSLQAYGHVAKVPSSFLTATLFHVDNLLDFFAFDDAGVEEFALSLSPRELKLLFYAIRHSLVVPSSSRPIRLRYLDPDRNPWQFQLYEMEGQPLLMVPPPDTGVDMRLQLYLWTLARFDNMRGSQSYLTLQAVGNNVDTMHIHLADPVLLSEHISYILETVPEAKTNIHTITISFNSRITSLPLHHLEKFQALSTLDLSHLGLDYLEVPSSVQKLLLVDNRFTMCSSITVPRPLLELHLDENPVSQCGRRVAHSVHLGPFPIDAGHVVAVPWATIAEMLENDPSSVLDRYTIDDPYPIPDWQRSVVMAYASTASDDTVVSMIRHGMLSPVSSLGFSPRPRYLLEDAIHRDHRRTVAALVNIATSSPIQVAIVGGERYVIQVEGPTSFQLAGIRQLLVVDNDFSLTAASHPIIDTDPASYIDPRLHAVTVLNDQLVCHKTACGRCSKNYVFVDADDIVASSERCLVTSSDFFRLEPKNTHSVAVALAGQGDEFHAAVAVAWMSQLTNALWDQVDMDIYLRLGTDTHEAIVVPSPLTLSSPATDEAKQRVCLITGALAIALNHYSSEDSNPLPFHLPLDPLFLHRLLVDGPPSDSHIRGSVLYRHIASIIGKPAFANSFYREEGSFGYLPRPTNRMQPLIDNPDTVNDDTRTEIILEYVRTVTDALYSDTNAVFKTARQCFRRVLRPALLSVPSDVAAIADVITQRQVLSAQELLHVTTFTGFESEDGQRIKQLLENEFVQSDELRPKLVELITATPFWKPNAAMNEIHILFRPALGGLPQVVSCLNSLVIRSGNVASFVKDMHRTLEYQRFSE